MDQRNNIVLLICFLLALLTWLVISLSSEKHYSIDIPTQYSVSSNKMILSELPEHQKLTVHGRTSDLLRFENGINRNHFQLNINASDDLEIDRINAELVRLLDGYNLELIRNHTGSIPLELDSMASKVVPIFNNSELTAKEGFAIIEHRISPDQVRISGPVSFINFIDSIHTSKTVLKNIDRDIRDSVFLIKSVSELISMDFEQVLLSVRAERLISRDVTFASDDLNITGSAYDSIIIHVKCPVSHDLHSSMFQAQFTQDGNENNLIEIHSLYPEIIQVLGNTFVESE